MLQNLSSIPADPLFGLQQQFLQCQNPKKINLGIGIFADDEGNPFVFESVQKAAKNIPTHNFNYLSMRGDVNFLNNVGKMLFADFFSEKSEGKEEKFASQQCAGGTHGIKIFADLVKRDNKKPKIFFATPTWANHYGLFEGFEIAEFSHCVWKKSEKTAEKDETIDMVFAMEEYEKALQLAQEGDFLLLHGGKTHNPTGINASLEELEKIIVLANEKKVCLVVDYAYFGLGEGFSEDQQWSRIFAEKAENFALIVSFSKNAALYRHRLGALFIKTSDQKTEIINQNLENIVRESISNPPAFGAMVMNEIFSNPKAFENWKNELENMRKQLNERRESLFVATGKKMLHLQKTRGMFALLGISSEKVENLQQKNAVFLPKSGRINFGGLKPKEVEIVAESLS